jgi:hypothetical protein
MSAVHTFTRKQHIQIARAKLHAAASNRNNPAWNEFYWTMLGWVHNSRCAALSTVRVEQLDLFA